VQVHVHLAFQESIRIFKAVLGVWIVYKEIIKQTTLLFFATHVKEARSIAKLHKAFALFVPQDSIKIQHKLLFAWTVLYQPFNHLVEQVFAPCAYQAHIKQFPWQLFVILVFKESIIIQKAGQLLVYPAHNAA
jgi:hypothetical protein